jgi:hypothetical protein
MLTGPPPKFHGTWDILLIVNQQTHWLLLALTLAVMLAEILSRPVDGVVSGDLRFG